MAKKTKEAEDERELREVFRVFDKNSRGVIDVGFQLSIKTKSILFRSHNKRRLQIWKWSSKHWILTCQMMKSNKSSRKSMKMVQALWIMKVSLVILWIIYKLLSSIFCSIYRILQIDDWLNWTKILISVSFIIGGFDFITIFLVICRLFSSSLLVLLHQRLSE